MASVIHYLIHGTRSGIFALILIFVGLTIYSFAAISIHKNSSFSKDDSALSHRLVGAGFILSGFLVIALTVFFGYQPIGADEYAHLTNDVSTLPEMRPLLQAYLQKNPKLNQIDYFMMQREFEDLKKQLYVEKLNKLS